MNKRKGILAILVFVVILLVTFSIIGKKEENKAELIDPNYLQNNIIGESNLEENVKVLTEKEVLQLDKGIENIKTIDEKTIEVIFDKKIPNFISKLNDGDIFLVEPLLNPNSSIGNGYIGKIESINKDTKIVTIVTPSIDEVFTKLHIETNKDAVAELSYVEARGVSQNLRGRSRGATDNGNIVLDDNIELSFVSKQDNKIGKYFEKLELKFKDFKIGELKKDPIIVNGAIKLEDLVVNPVVDYTKEDNVKQNDIKIAGDMTSELSVNLKLEENKGDKTFGLCYIAWDIGKISLGVGDKKLVAGVGLSFNVDLQGEITVTAGLTLKNELSFNIDTENEDNYVKGKNYPNKYIKRDSDNKNDTDVNCTVSIDGQATGKLEALAGIKVRVAILNLDLIGTKVGGGIDGALNMDVPTGIKYENKKFTADLKNNEDLEVSGNLDFVVKFKVYTEFLDADKKPSFKKKENVLEYSKDLFRLTIIEFILPKDQTEEKMGIINGYWLIENSDAPNLFHRINFDNNEKACYAAGIMEFSAGDISNVKYNKEENSITMDVRYEGYGNEPSETYREKYKIIDENTLELTNNKGTKLRYNRTSYNELAYVMYGQQIYLATENFMNISNADFRDSHYNFTINDIFVDNKKQKENIDKNKALSLFGNLGMPNELDILEENIIPNIRSYYVYNKSFGGTLNPALVFEGEETPNSCMEIYKSHAKVQ